MSLVPERIAAALIAAVAAISLAACTSPTEATEGAQVDSRIPDSPVITGEPAGYNAQDVSFATNVISDHKQAIELVKLVPDRSTNPEVVALASQISAVQQPEINIMNVFLVQWNENPDMGDNPDGGEGPAGQGPAMPSTIDDATMARLESLRGPEFDTLWLKTMMSHRQGALESANAEVANGANVDARAMAETMVATQEAEIEQMKQMLEGSEP